jgi:hypothetical protein
MRVLNVGFPTVEQTADAVALAAADHQRSLPMAAMLVENPDGPLGIAEGDELVAADFERKRIAVGRREIRRLQDRKPVAPERLAHRRVAADPTHEFVVLAREHREPSLDCVSIFRGRSKIGSSWRRRQ